MTMISSTMRFACVGIGLIVASAAAEAKVYRCTVNGETTYTDRPCAGTDSETVSLSAPRSPGVATPGVATPGVATPPTATSEPPKIASGIASAPVVKPTATSTEAKSDVSAPRAAASIAPPSSGQGWRLAGGYSDHVKDADSHRSVTRTSYGIECDGNKALRPTVYGLNNRYSLKTPDRTGKMALQGPYFDSLDAAARSACAAK